MAKQFPYDAACKALFGEEIIFRNLLANYGILPDRDIGAITAVRLLSPNLETEKASRRMADLIWAVTFPQGEVHVLLEFQRGRDETMANRMAVYAHLHMAKLLTQKKPPGQLPAILPIVIYLGEKPWNCARHSHELYAPAPAQLPVAPYGGSYHLLDVHRLEPAVLEKAGPAAFLFQLEHVKSYPEAYDATEKLLRRCPGPKYARLRRIVMNLLNAYTINSGWTDNFYSPLSEEDVTVMLGRLRRYHNQELRRIESRGEARGEARGREEGEATALGRHIAGLAALIAQRFGSVPERWQRYIDAISNPVVVNRLLLSTYGCATAEEFELQLEQAARGE